MLSFYNTASPGAQRNWGSIPSPRMSGNNLKLFQGRLKLDIWEFFSHRKGCKALDQAGQGSDGIAIPKKTWTWHLGMWFRLDLMILKVFSNLNNSTIPWKINPSFSELSITPGKTGKRTKGTTSIVHQERVEVEKIPQGATGTFPNCGKTGIQALEKLCGARGMKSQEEIEL